MSDNRKYIIESYGDRNNKGLLVKEVATGRRVAYENEASKFDDLKRYCKFINKNAVGFNGWTPEFIFNAFRWNNSERVPSLIKRV